MAARTARRTASGSGWKTRCRAACWRCWAMLSAMRRRAAALSARSVRSSRESGGMLSSGTACEEAWVARGDGETGRRVCEWCGPRVGVETLEDIAECERTRLARRKVKKAGQGVSID